MILPVVIVHYHLRQGGVTKIIEQQVEALQRLETPYLILTGERYRGDRGLRQIEIPALGYLEEANDLKVESEALYLSCLDAVQECFGTQEVVWHIHNPAIGKNVLFPRFITHLAEEKKKMLLLCHDFSEDGRPKNYLLGVHEETLYPLAPNVHYAFINSRDQAIFHRSGLPEKNGHHLPNAISARKQERSPPLSLFQNIIFYPVRGIRRKNLGEFLLWSVLAPADTLFALSLAPVNEQWKPYYGIWEALVEELDLPVHLDCANRISPPNQEGSSFSDWLSAATHCFTTSVAEGFGLVFLEPNALGIPLLGRDLPEITKDFKEAGVIFPGLYQKLLVPLEVLDEKELKRELEEGLEVSYLSYQKPYNSSALKTAWKAMTKDGMVDFGNLPEHLQLDLIIRAHRDDFRGFFIKQEDGQLLAAADWLAEALDKLHPSPDLSAYDPLAYQANFHNLLTKVSAETPSKPKWIKREKVLNEFLRPETFHFLRT